MYQCVYIRIVYLFSARVESNSMRGDEIGWGGFGVRGGREGEDFESCMPLI
jgi:hypothetical protein